MEIEEPSPQSRQEEIERQKEAYEAKGGTSEICKTKTTKQIIDEMKSDAAKGSWNSSEIADLEERKRMKKKKLLAE